MSFFKVFNIDRDELQCRFCSLYSNFIIFLILTNDSRLKRLRISNRDGLWRYGGVCLNANQY